MVNHCGRRVKRCSDCGHRYPKSEYELWECPDCGKSRKCRAKVKREGAACKLHGGASLKGVASPRYRGKGYSKYLDGEMLTDYLEFAEDPDRVSVVMELDLMRSLLASRVEMLSQINSMELWEQAKDLYDTAMKAQKRKDLQAFAQGITDLGEILEQGVGLSERFQGIQDTSEAVRKLVDTERRIMADKGEMMTRAAVLLRIDALIGLVIGELEGLPDGKNIISKITGLYGEMVGVSDIPKITKG